jgi:hypothetical protein
MTQIRTAHTLPTHLNARDPVLWGLDDVRLVKLGTGVLVAAVLWRQPALPFGLRTALGGLVLLAAAACALIRVEGRSLEEWLLGAGRYWARPRTLVWGPRSSNHRWTLATTASLPGRPLGGCSIRHLRITWLDPEEGTPPESDDLDPKLEQAA